MTCSCVFLPGSSPISEACPVHAAQLTRQPARPLTSREIARIISGLVGGLAQWCSPTEITAALDHLHQHRATYLEMWRRVSPRR